MPRSSGARRSRPTSSRSRRNRNLCGIRRLIETERDPSFCLAPDFLAALRLLPKHGLTFDICVKHWAMVYALELVSAAARR